ncbi:MAG: SRPBCC family protein [Acidobacteriaceae bacterium]
MLLCGLLVCLVAQALQAAELKKQTAAAFDRYIAASEKRMQAELKNGPFLSMDALPEEHRREAYAQLQEGLILVNPVNAKVGGSPMKVPGGLIHDWVGVVFIPNVSLAQTLAVAQNYDDYQSIYWPEVRRSRLVQRSGDNFKVFLQFYKKSLVTVVVNVDFDIDYKRLGADRVVSDSHSTRIAEVEDAGQADERELPVDGGHGYLWRLDSYWRLEEKDGGVYVQLESIGLSRGVPAVFAWLVNPLLRSVPHGALTDMLGATRRFVAKPDQTQP